MYFGYSIDCFFLARDLSIYNLFAYDYKNPILYLIVFSNLRY